MDEEWKKWESGTQEVQGWQRQGQDEPAVEAFLSALREWGRTGLCVMGGD